VLFFSGLSLYAAMFLLPLYYQEVRGQDALAAGLLLAPQGLGALLNRPVGPLVDIEMVVIFMKDIEESNRTVTKKG
jgi:hypothetical protein